MNLKISSAFTTAPGPRYIVEGKNSGEQFRNDILFPKFQEAKAANEKLVVNLDGTSGYGTSFLEESFGGLIRENKCTLDQINAVLQLVSEEEPALLDDILDYMKDAESERITTK